MRMRSTAVRHRFVYARSLLRRLLGGYLGLSPEKVAIGYSSTGKPVLADTELGREWHFNVSHSAAVLLIAVGRGRPVGVDVERVRPKFDYSAVARRYLAAEEVRQLERLDPAERRQAFFRVWARKEAFVKAHGGGIALGLNRFVVPVALGEGPTVQLSADGEGTCHPRQWSLWDLEVGPGYAAALCAAGAGGTLRRWRWPGDAVPAVAPSTEGAE